MAAADQPHAGDGSGAGGDEKEKDLLASVVGDIRRYSGPDPLRPWLRGMRRMEAAMSPVTLREKLPRFLQKCAQEFQDDARYRDDLRYLRVWIQLMDYVKDAKPLLKKMERSKIGHKRVEFYMAYAIYYEKHKRLEEAENMYRLGIQNLAEPTEKLHKSHEMFLQRMEIYKRRKDKERMPKKSGSVATGMKQIEGESRNCTVLKSNPLQKSGSSSNPSLCYPPIGPAKAGVLSRGTSRESKNLSRCNSDDTVVVRFVGSALVGKSETEDACHHGLVEPTINTKEAMDAINNMFLEPLEPETILKKRSKNNQPKYNQQTSSFEIFVDEDEPNNNDPNALHDKNMKSGHPNISQQASAFQIFVDEDDPNGSNQNTGQNGNIKKESRKLSQKTSGFEIFVDENEPNGNDENAMCHQKTKCPTRPLCDSLRQQGNGDLQQPFVGEFAILADDEDMQCGENNDGVQINSRTVHWSHDKDTFLQPEQADSETKFCEGSRPVISGLQEDTIIHRFVGSTVVDESKVENACHHGLVDPTVNLKEAMDDINSMFGKPLNFKSEKTYNKKTNAVLKRKDASTSSFSILADDDVEKSCAAQTKPSNTCKFGSQSDLFEPTITTRDVMSEINDMFGMPLDF